MPAAESPINGVDRIRFGYIVTAREQDSDARWVLHRAGPGALVEICEVLDASEGNWRILTISTPETIYRDLQGTRLTVWRDVIENPEQRMLGGIGRLDLLDPFHDPAVPRGSSHA